MKSILRTTFGLLAGCLVAVAIATAAALTARASWPEYAAAEPHKNYTLMMLFVRLLVGAVSVAFAACATTAVSHDNGRAAWWLGGLFLALSIPDHLYPGYAFKDYPAWYHLSYLSYLVPVAGLSARFFMCWSHSKSQ